MDETGAHGRHQDIRPGDSNPKDVPGRQVSPCPPPCRHAESRMEGFVLGIDIGTSGVRAAAVDAAGVVLGIGRATLPPTRITGNRREQDPEAWWRALGMALRQLERHVALREARALCIDGTSGTILPVDAANRPLAAARMYDDAETGEAAAVIMRLAPRESAAHGASSPAARARQWMGSTGLHQVIHQADWILRRLSGREETDENNALKTGYDPIARRWPGWLDAYGLPSARLPTVVPAGTPLGPLGKANEASALGLGPDTIAVAGTTDGCATFMASGASACGEASTSLGSTLVLKVLSEQPVFAPELGVYSHRLGAQWLVGGASNCGGRSLLAHFTPGQLAAIAPRLRPETATGLDYYPLPQAGERFPVADATLMPRLTPRPADDALFVQGILEGLCRIERSGYAKLGELGAAMPTSIRPAGGGTRDVAWMRLRERIIGIPSHPSWSEEAAVGAARLAWQGLRWKVPV